MTQELKQLGKIPDSVLAQRFGRTITETVAEREKRRINLPIAARQWTANEIKMLGKFNDCEVARRLCRTPDQVRKQRIRFGIPSIKPQQIKKWTRAEEKLVGTAPTGISHLS